MFMVGGGILLHGIAHGLYARLGQILGAWSGLIESLLAMVVGACIGAGAYGTVALVRLIQKSIRSKGKSLMDKKIINPWKWQDKLGFVHGNDITGAKQTLYCAGQVSVDAEGNPIHAGDMAAQLNTAFDNLEEVLRQAGYQLSDVVRLNYYTTSVSAFSGNGQVVGERLAKGNCRPCSTLLGVASLFHPDAMIEIEATAVKSTEEYKKQSRVYE
jgi:enamine deaminase RidA (YjgF/YER057c/UK114 family)